MSDLKVWVRNMYSGPDSEPYMAVHSPWPLLVNELKNACFFFLSIAFVAIL